MNYNFVHLTDLFNYMNFKVSHIFHRTLDKEWSFNNHCHNFNRVYFVLDGHGYLYNDIERVDLLPNYIYIIPANSCYNYRCDDYMEKLFIHFTISIIPQKDLLSNIHKIVTLPAGKDEMNRIKKIFYEQNIKSALFLQNYIYNLVFPIIEPYAGQIDADISLYKKYNKLYQYINDHLYADISVAEACHYIGFSQGYIGRVFKEDTGQTIKEYITALMIEKLKYLLQFTKLSLKSIANDLHFNNEFYCSKFFKKHVGISPREYRKKHGWI